MRITLSAFEQQIEESILQRGLTCFEGGAVGEVEQVSPGAYEAVVSGSENYVVRIAVKGDKIERHACDCPFDGPVCKHVAAVLFHLKRGELGLVVRRKGRGAKGSVPERKRTLTLMEKVASVVDGMAHEELKEFILLRCGQDKVLRGAFVDAYEERSGGTTHAGHARRIRAIINTNGGRGRANGWYAAKPVSQALQPMLGKLSACMANGDHALALPLATALLDELTKALDHIDDSNGYVVGDLGTAHEALHAASEAPADEAVRKELLAFALKALQDDRYSGWDWHTGMMAISVRLVRTEAEAAPVLKALQRVSFPPSPTTMRASRRWSLSAGCAARRPRMPT